MTPIPEFKVGDYIIDSEQIYAITDIKDGRLFYRPVKDAVSNSNVTGSIPVQNAVPAGFRRLLSSDEITTFFKTLAGADSKEVIEQKFYREIICQNDPTKTIPLLYQLSPKSNNGVPVISSSNNKYTFNTLIDHISEEFSLTGKKPVDFYKQKILKTITSTLGK